MEEHGLQTKRSGLEEAEEIEHRCEEYRQAEEESVFTTSPSNTYAPL